MEVVKNRNEEEFYTLAEVDAILRKVGFREDAFTRDFRTYYSEKFKEVSEIKSRLRVYRKEFIDSLELGYIEKLQIKERSLICPKGTSIYLELLKYHYNEPSILEVFEDYYSNSEMTKILEKIGISASNFNETFLDYSKTEYEKFIIKLDETFYYNKKFVDSLDFDYLQRVVGKGRFNQSMMGNIALEFFKYSYKEDNKLEIYENIYVTKEVVQICKENGINIESDSRSFLSALKDNPNMYQEVIIKDNSMYLYSKKIIDSMDFEFLKLLQKYNCINIFDTYFKYHQFGIITVAVATKILEGNLETISKIMKEKRKQIFTPVDQGENYIKFDEVLAWSEFKKNVFGVHEIIEEIIKIIPEDIRKDRCFYNRQVTILYKRGLFDDFSPVKEQDTPFKRSKTQNQLYIKNIYKDEVYEIIEKFLLKRSIEMSDFSKVETFKIAYTRFNQKRANKTAFEDLRLFAIDRISKISKIGPTTYLPILYAIERLDKSLAKCDTEEVLNMFGSIEIKESKNEFSYFLKHFRSLRKVKYSDINYDKYADAEERNVKPYSMEQYIRFGFLVWSDSHKWYESYKEKALKSRISCSIWLYAALHYISAWRKGDMIKQFPRPNLNMEPEVFLQKVKNGELDDKVAMDIVNQVNFMIEVEAPIPSKTRNYNPASLVLQIPESVYVFLGTLIGIAEAHAQIQRADVLISDNCIKRKHQRDFFGDEFEDIFGDDAFINLRATKNYEQLITTYGDEKKVGTGYVLASVARSHKFTYSKVAETTKIYLRYYKDMEDSEIIFRELFERGVCSFAPYLLVKIMEGEDAIRLLSPKEQTKKIKSLNTKDPYDIEMFLETANDSLSHSKMVISNFIEYAGSNGLDPKELAEQALIRLAYNQAPSKQDKIPCMLRAQGRECIYPKREFCVGCGYEIYVKSCLFELGQRINKSKQKALTSKTKNSKTKNILLIQNVFSPIAKDIIHTLKNVNKVENLDEYLKLLK